MTWERIWASWPPTPAAGPQASADRLVLTGLAPDLGRLIIGTGSAPPNASVFRVRHRHPADAPAHPAAAPFLLVVRVFAAHIDRDEFRRWLDEEHCVRQLALPGVRWYAGYEEDGGRHSFLNIWGLDEPTVVDGDAWDRVRDTPWWAQVRHVTEGADRGVYRPATRVSR